MSSYFQKLLKFLNLHRRSLADKFLHDVQMSGHYRPIQSRHAVVAGLVYQNRDHLLVEYLPHLDGISLATRQDQLLVLSAHLGEEAGERIKSIVEAASRSTLSLSTVTRRTRSLDVVHEDCNFFRLKDSNETNDARKKTKR